MESERTSPELHTARVSRRPPRAAATAMTLGIIFALAYVFFLRAPPPVPTPHIAGIQGTYTWRVDGRNGDLSSQDSDGTFSAVASGNAGGQSNEPRGEVFSRVWFPESTYDAAKRNELTAAGVGPNTLYSRTIGAWPPVWRVATRSPLDYQGLAAIVRAALEDGDRSIGIKPLKDGDRKVWRAAMTLDAQDIELVVDQVAGVVLWYTDGHSTFTAKVGWDTAPPAQETYVVKVPAGAKVTTKADEAFSYAFSPAAAGRTAGYAPLMSDLAPDGFSLRAVATADASGVPGEWLVPDGHSMPIESLAGKRQVAQLYTRGLSWFTVQQLGPEAAAKSVAYLRGTLGSIAADKLSFERTTLQYGAFTGTTAYTWYDMTGPTLFVSDARYIVYATGALTRQELISYAEGLEPLGSGASASPSPSP